MSSLGHPLPAPGPFASLTPRDRRLVWIIGLSILALIILLGFASAPDDDKNPLPGSSLASRHGAMAAFTLLARSGYPITRWNQPLPLLADQADSSTVLILAQPNPADPDNIRAIRTILDKGGRVLATGLIGATLLPGHVVRPITNPVDGLLCQATPQGLSPVAVPGPVWMEPQALWGTANPAASPAQHVDAACAAGATVVDYPWSKGHVVWWANSTPLENSRIAQDRDLDLLLASIGPDGTATAHGQPIHIFWDESLHGLGHTRWDYTSGPIWPLAQGGFWTIVLLLILSFSRRWGPIRPLPEPPRATPVEFLSALGGLYQAAGASATAVAIAWDHFRSVAAAQLGVRAPDLSAAEIAERLQHRFGQPMPELAAELTTDLAADLAAVEAACHDETLKPKRALALVRLLHRHEATLRAATGQASGQARAQPPATAA